VNGAEILTELVIVLGTAAAVTVVFQALRMPLVLGYVLAGLVIGPHVPVPLVANVALIRELSELGVILLMFTIGLELPLVKIARVGVPGAIAAVFEVAVVVAVGTLVATLLGFEPVTAVFAGACLGISSTMLVAKTFDELGWKGGFTETVFAILVFEDVIAIVLLAIVAAVATGSGLDAAALGRLLVKLGGFLALIAVGGLLVVPRVVRWIGNHARRETLLIASLLVCFGMAVLAARAGYSVALGAFIAGVLVAESGHGQTVYEHVEVLRDVFSMMFFISVGMQIDPALLLAEAPRIGVLAIVVLLFKPLGVTIGAFLAGNGVHTGVRAGLTLAQIGEFSFVIAGVLGDARLLAIAVGVSCATTLVSPLLVRRSERIAAFALGRLPRRIATFVSFYESWLGRFRASAPASSRRGRYRRRILILVIDAAIIIAIIIAGATIGGQALADAGLTDTMRAVVQIGAITVASLPFAISLMRTAALLARALATAIIPRGDELDLGRAARRSLVAMFELGIALAVLAPIVATVQPFVPGSFAALLVVSLPLVLLVRRSITDFDGHVRASSEVILELLSGPSTTQQLPGLDSVLPGFGDTVTIAIPERATSVGQTLADLDVRAKTGATVLAIARAGHGMATPSPKEPLHAGDVLALAGSPEAIESARTLLAS